MIRGTAVDTIVWSRATRKTIAANATQMRVNLMPVGYSVVSSASTSSAPWCEVPSDVLMVLPSYVELRAVSSPGETRASGTALCVEVEATSGTALTVVDMVEEGR